MDDHGTRASKATKIAGAGGTANKSHDHSGPKGCDD
jgi:hypothetical protein